MYEIDRILNKSENVLWKGKPVFLPFVVGNSLGSIFFGLIWMGFLTPFIITMGPLVFLLPHFWVGIAFIFINPVYQIISYKYIYYAITDKRVIIQKGVIGRDFDIIDFDKITNVEVRVDLIDIIFGRKTGSILISTPTTVVVTSKGTSNRPYTLSHIKSPYEVFRLLKKVSFDVKTDIYYPNKYRPDINPGYGTKYKPE